VARAIHDWSGRSGAFVAVNCAAIPEGLAEAELFGYRKGAFTGAEQAAVGYFRAAHGGTLLLDEVADLPLAVQAKLLRVIEQSDVQPLGESRATPVDVRIVAASLTSLARRVEEGAFRGDLFARLNGVTITLPSLVQRKDEVCGLFFELMRQRNGGVLLAVEAPLLDRLLQYAWPGNVRELDLLIRRLLGLHGHEGKLRVAHLSGTALEEPVAATSEPPVADGFSRDAHEGSRPRPHLAATRLSVG
jgi:transcriptional regulator with PAS, ATPase and Fis domain